MHDHDEVEFLIEQILARKEEADAGEPARDPSCPDEVLLMAVALEQAPEDRKREVEEHAAGCEECRWRLEDYRQYFSGKDVPEPTIEGSLLEIAARRSVVPKEKPGNETDSRLGALRGEVPVGYTGLAQSRENWPALSQGLRAWLPYLLSYVGLDASHTDAMLRYVEQRIPISQDERLSALLPGWLVDFARTVQPARTDISPVPITRSLVEKIALRLVLDPTSEDETDEQRRFRETAQAHAFSSVDDLLRFVPEGWELPRDVLEYRSDLYSRGREKTGEGLRLFQVA